MISIIPASLAVLCLCSTFDSETTKKCADLEVVEIRQPDWVEDRTVFEVEIRNVGRLESEATDAIAFDLDLSAQEAKDLRFPDWMVEAVEENNYLAEDYKDSKHLSDDVDENAYDYDRYWEEIISIPAIKPGKKMVLTFEIENYWIYDPNCEIRVILDPEETSGDCDEKNNVKTFLGWG
jgi:hypothetical protein